MGCLMSSLMLSLSIICDSVFFFALSHRKEVCDCPYMFMQSYNGGHPYIGGRT